MSSIERICKVTHYTHFNKVSVSVSVCVYVVHSVKLMVKKS